MKRTRELKGPIAWMAQNSVAANLFMIILLVGGLLFALQVKQEVFPEFEIDYIQTSVAYPGASPAEVEQGIILAIEEGVRGLDGIKKVQSIAVEGSGIVLTELETNANKNKALQDVKNAVDRITSFPQDAERPIVSLLTMRREVISIILYGDVDESELRQLGESVRLEMLKKPGVTQVELGGVRPLEISIEVSQEKLRTYNLTLDQIAHKVASTAIELPGGSVKTPGGEVLIRTAERRDFGSQFANIPLVSRADGTHVVLSDIATIIDGFRDTDQAAYCNGKPAVRVAVFRTGDQTPIEISQKAKDYAEELKQTLPSTIGVTTWLDSAEIYEGRLNLLLRNAGLGLVLVLLILGIFLEIRLAFWVTMGIPISILGSFLLFPVFDVTVNMISLFAFIVTLGIVVDDAVVVGENIYEFRQRGYNYVEAAILGAREVAVPVTFSILTNMAAFMPLMFVPGVTGKFFFVIPIIVVSVFGISWFESLFVLPSHLGHSKPWTPKGIFKLISYIQGFFASALQKFIDYLYDPLLNVTLRNRYLTLAIGLAVLTMTGGFVAAGHINFNFFPRVDSDTITADAVLPYGSPVEETKKVLDKMLIAAEQIIENHGGDRIKRGVMTFIGGNPFSGGLTGDPVSIGGSKSHLASVQVFLVDSDLRDLSAKQFSEEWREEVGNIPGLETLTFKYSAGPSAGAPIDIELSHPDINVLRSAAAELAKSLEIFNGVKDIDDGFEVGKPQFDMKIKPEAQSLGLTASDLARQVRSAFYGSRAFRQQRGREEIWIMVRLPEAERESIFNIEDFLIRTPQGGEIPLTEAAEIELGRAYTRINRTDGHRVVNVTGDIVYGVANADKVIADVQRDILPGILGRYPGLSYSLEGEQREQNESMSSILTGFLLAQIVIFAMLAIPFRSYIQPIIVMFSIPFGMVGVVIGHVIMGYDLSFVSMMGTVALSGVVVNDSLVLVHAANGARDKGETPLEAITYAGKRRLRPIMLTSFTTFFGLMPMIMETSVQARFLIPMAIALGYGIMFATLIALLLVPALYLIVEDFKKIVGIKNHVKLEPSIKKLSNPEETLSY